MQCPSCRVVYSDGMDLCPRCSTPSIKNQPVAAKFEPKLSTKDSVTMASDDPDIELPKVVAASPPSTLIEFPGAGRTSQPLWRKELSERVREIQERRSRESEREANERRIKQFAHVLDDEGGMPLGLVPQPDQPPLNPLVAAALKRIERAQQSPHRTHNQTTRRGASVAVARVVEEQYETQREIQPRPSAVPVQGKKVESVSHKPQAETRRPHALSVVQPKLIPEDLIAEVKVSVAKKIIAPTPTHELESTGTLAAGDYYDDHAPFSSRVVAGVIDLLVVAFASSPFAAIIELTNGDWTDEKVIASMSGIMGLIMFLYLTTSTTIGGRTWGMSLLSLRAVDVDSGLPPSTKQSVKRAFVYMLSLITFGLGILYALVDAEHRSVHDHLSGTTVVRE